MDGFIDFVTDLAVLQLSPESSRKIASALSELHADLVDRNRKPLECLKELFEVMAAEVLANHQGEVEHLLYQLPGLLYDIGRDKSWIARPGPPPQRRIRGYFVGADPTILIRQPPVPTPSRETLVPLGHHEVSRSYADNVRSWFAGGMERWRGRVMARQATRSSMKPLAKRKYGFPADEADHRKVVACVKEFGNEWKSHLADICLRLQKEKARFPKNLESENVVSWKQLAPTVKVSGASAAREKLLKYIHYRLKSLR